MLEAMRWAATLAIGLCLAASTSHAQPIPPGYGAAASAEESQQQPPLPPGYLEHEPPERAPTASPFTPAEEAAIRAEHAYRLEQRKRYRLVPPIVMGASSSVALIWGSMFLVSEKDTSFGAPDPTHLRRYRAWVGVTTLMVAGALTWLLTQIVGRVRWARRFRPVHERFLQLPQPPPPTRLRW